ncbi:MAG: hypothetical protein IJU75_02700 [Clostridia bacterium]|nr:hypothetical protein [Clostridia bacterium]
MKKLFNLLTILLCLLLCACNTNNVITGEEISVDKKTPSVSSIEFASLRELQNALDSRNENKLFVDFLEQGATNKQIENLRSMVKAIRLHNNIVPYLNGEVIELRNEDGFSNITLFASEKYELPCIFYHPKVSTGDNLYIEVTCIPDEFLQGHETESASDFIRRMSPNYPNIDNLGSQCQAVYTTIVELSDRNVTALVYEYKTSNRNSTMFVYDNLLVEVRNNPEVWNLEWFSTLSFGGF